MNDALTKFLKRAEDHYWDSFEEDRKIILCHINQIAMQVRKIIYDENESGVENDGLKPCGYCGYKNLEKDSHCHQCCNKF